MSVLEYFAAMVVAFIVANRVGKLIDDAGKRRHDRYVAKRMADIDGGDLLARQVQTIRELDELHARLTRVKDERPARTVARDLHLGRSPEEVEWDQRQRAESTPSAQALVSERTDDAHECSERGVEALLDLDPPSEVIGGVERAGCSGRVGECPDSMQGAGDFVGDLEGAAFVSGHGGAPDSSLGEISEGTAAAGAPSPAAPFGGPVEVTFPPGFSPGAGVGGVA